jgi:glycerol-1-phosphate dehydrogenase [NAD(P)+]
MKKIMNLPVIEIQPFKEVVEKRPSLLVTSPPAWAAVKNDLRGLTVTHTIQVNGATIHHWDTLLADLLGQPEVVYAVGGGLTADAGKYFAAKLGLPFTVLPTALSVDAFITAASGIRQDGCVQYIDTKVPDRVILDLQTISRAPATIRAAGITDVMSIATGSWDWRFAHEMGRNPPGMEFISWVYENAQAILRGVLDCAEAAGAGDPQGLKTLFDCLCMEVQLCNQIGHSRPEEGSEHYFAYAVENELGPGLPHGDLVGPGILRMAELQNQPTEQLRQALAACHIPVDRIPEDAFQRTLAILPEYCRRHNLPFGIAHTTDQH